jgi:hypothetical protein
LISIRRLLAALTLTLAFVAGRPAAAQTAADKQCVPQCRTGYVCVEGACVSACNPPCAAGEMCASDGNCVASQPPPASAPAAAAPPAAAPPPAAQPAPAYPPPPAQDGLTLPQTQEPEKPKDEHFHDGFYFRFGFGLGALSGTVVDAEADDPEDFDITGFTTAGELAFGGTPTPGIVIGGGFFGSNTPTVTIDDDFEGDALGISSMALFIDVYPNPHQGLHFGGGLGLALISAVESDEGLPDDYFGTGVGVHAAVGYEGWVGKQWGIGVQGRLLYTSGTIYAASGDYDDIDIEAFVPAVMFTATCH